MANIDKDKLNQTYGINDDKFIEYLNKFNTLKKIVNIGDATVVPKEKIMNVYNRFIYYNSLGHNLDTIVDETIPIIKKLFFDNESGYYNYKLPAIDTSLINTEDKCLVFISNRICMLRLIFSTKVEIPANTLLFKLAPSPVSNICETVITNNGDVKFLIDYDGIVTTNKILPNTVVNTSVTYIISK